MMGFEPSEVGLDITDLYAEAIEFLVKQKI
jgi:hypothetical protein